MSSVYDDDRDTGTRRRYVTPRTRIKRDRTTSGDAYAEAHYERYERDGYRGRSSRDDYDDASVGYGRRGVAPGLLSRVSWGAIFAGSVTAIGVMMLLSLLGLSLGAGMIDPAYDERPLAGMGIGALLWFGLSSLAALFAGGYVAGQMSGLPDKESAGLHGVVVWAVATLVFGYVSTSTAGQMISGATGVLQSAASASATAVSSTLSATANAAGGLVTAAQQAAPDQLPPTVRRALERNDVTVQDARQRLVNLLNSAGLGQQDVQEAQQATQNLVRDVVSTPSDISADFGQFADKLLGGPNAVISDQERQQALQVIQERTGLTPQQAEQRLNQIQKQVADARQTLETQINQAQETAVQTAETAMNTLTQAALAAFIASLIGLMAAAGGATVGSPTYPRMDDDEDDDDDY